MSHFLDIYCQTQYNPFVHRASGFLGASGICRNHFQLQLELLMTLMCMNLGIKSQLWVFWSWHEAFYVGYQLIQIAKHLSQTTHCTHHSRHSMKREKLQHWSSTSDANRYILQNAQSRYQWSYNSYITKTTRPYNTLILLIFQFSSILISTIVTMRNTRALNIENTSLESLPLRCTCPLVSPWKETIRKLRPEGAWPAG